MWALYFRLTKFFEYLSKDPIERKNYHDQLTMSMLYAYCEHYILTLGSRDVGTLKDFADKLPGSEEQKNAQIREAYAYMMLHPGCKMMAPDKDMPKELEVFVKDLNNMYLAHPALYQLCIEDNGTLGSKIPDIQTDADSNKMETVSGGMGLSNIRDRVKALGGTVQITQEKGFRIFVTIPKSGSN